ncbi:MAG: diacylglycerol kinase catalytic region [Verrucomicrobia bacterium]|nr:diacylglycerol kinase catalytic region [Verrucomicrobiota bacterium]
MLRRLKTRFIVNPFSGHASRALARVRAHAAASGAEVHLTARPRHATELALMALADDCELVVAVGGDGTLNEVATALVGTDAVFGLVPCGSGDGLGRHLGIHGTISHALEILRSGHSRRIDTGLADGHPFFTAAGVGFEAEVSARFNRLSSRGFLRYLTTSAALWRTFEPEDYQIEQDGRVTTVRAFTVAIANADQYGNNARIAPGGRIDDGLLNLTAVPPVSFVNGLPLLLRLFNGTIGGAHGVCRLTGPRFAVTRSNAGLIHTDGEVHAAGPRVEFVIRPLSLRVMAPDGRHKSS